MSRYREDNDSFWNSSHTDTITINWANGSDNNKPFLQLSSNRLSTNLSPPGDSAAIMIAAESRQFAQCVENINVLNLRLKNADERCVALKEELRRARQVRQASGFRAKIFRTLSLSTWGNHKHSDYLH